MFNRKTIAAWLMLAAAGCTSGRDIPLGVPQLQTTPIGQQQQPAEDYRIGPRDTLSVRVVGEPDLTLDEQAVSLAGNLSMPLLGQVPVAGRTVEEVAQTVTAGLNSRYLRRANVAVAVVKATNYTFTIEGQVQRPGVYEIPGRVSLMQTLALGGGLTNDADQQDIIVIRHMNGQDYAARFNVADIRYARYPDPEIRQSDLIMVGTSERGRFTRQLIGALPALAAVAGIFLALR